MASSCDDILDHPEVLDRDKLVEILQKRCIPLDEIDGLDKEHLIVLFYKYVSPLPQRIHQLRRSKRSQQQTKSVSSSKKTFDNRKR